MAENACESPLLMSAIRDLRDVPISRVHGAYAAEVDTIVSRLVESAVAPSRPSVAAFNSAI
jgi:hypothetical protein